MKRSDAFVKAAKIIFNRKCYGCCVALSMTDMPSDGHRFFKAMFKPEGDSPLAYWWPETSSNLPRQLALLFCAEIAKDFERQVGRHPMKRPMYPDLLP